MSDLSDTDEGNIVLFLEILELGVVWKHFKDNTSQFSKGK